MPGPEPAVRSSTGTAGLPEPVVPPVATCACIGLASYLMRAPGWELPIKVISLYGGRCQGCRPRRSKRGAGRLPTAGPSSVLADLGADKGRHFGAVKLDVPHDRTMGQGPCAGLEIEARKTKAGYHVDDLFRHGAW